MRSAIVLIFLCGSGLALGATGDAVKGGLVFRDHCQMCHGVGGKWTAPMTTANPRLPDFKTLMKRSDDDLLHYITYRAATTDYYYSMTAAEIRNLAAFMRALANGAPPAPAEQAKAPSVPAADGAPADTVRGGMVYLRRCVMCHAPDGKGTANLRKAYQDRLPRFAEEGFWTGNDRPVAERIEAGGHGDALAGLAPGELRDVGAYLRTLRGQRLAAAPASNARCTVCHESFANDPLIAGHLKKTVTCEKCHGFSTAHAADKTGQAPPDLRHTAAQAGALCVMCHARHRHKAEDLKGRPEQNCMGCHKAHELETRQRRWDKDGMLVRGESKPD